MTYQCLRCELRTPAEGKLCPLCSKTHVVCTNCGGISPIISRGVAGPSFCAECFVSSTGLCSKCGKVIIDSSGFSTIRLGRRGRGAMSVCAGCRAEMMPLANLHGLPKPGENIFRDESLLSSIEDLKLLTYELSIPFGPWLKAADRLRATALIEAVGKIRQPITIVLYPSWPMQGGKPTGKTYIGSWKGRTDAYSALPEACRSYLLHQAGGYESTEGAPSAQDGYWPAYLASNLISYKIAPNKNGVIDWSSMLAPNYPITARDVSNFLWIDAARVAELARLARRRPYRHEGDFIDEPE